MIQTNEHITTFAHPKMAFTFVGVDSHKQSHTFVFLNFMFEKLGEITISNTPSDFSNFLIDAKKFLQPNTKFCFGFEDVHHYGRMIASFLITQGYTVKHTNANLVASERNSRNILQKNDSIDAECCGRVLIHRFDELPIASHDERFFIINLLVGKREFMSKQVKRFKGQLHELLYPHYPSYQKFFSNLDTKIALAFYEAYPTPHNLEGVTVLELTELFKGIMPQKRSEQKANLILSLIATEGVDVSPYQSSIDFTIRLTVRQLKATILEMDQIEHELAGFLKHFDYPLLSMKGIDVVTASRLISEIKDINRFPNASTLAHYSGIAPVTHASGNTDMKYANKRGNRQLNGIFNQLATNLITPNAGNQILNPFFYTYYRKKLAEGKTHKQAIKSVCRRLVNIIYGIMKHGQDYINPPTAYINEETGEIIEPNSNQQTHIEKIHASLK